MSRYTRTPVTSGFEVQSQLNQNFSDIQTAIDDTLSRVGDQPNQMEANIDMNSNRIYNLPTAASVTEPVTLGQFLGTATPATYYGAFNWVSTATASQTLFTGITPAYSPGNGNLTVYINGVRQHPTAYTETSSTSVTFSSGLDAGDEVLFVINEAIVDNTVPASLASTTTYQQGSAGSVSRTATSKLQETVSVLDFGAVGDGVTSNTTAIQNALNSGAKRVIFPPGAYVTGPLTFPDWIEVVGIGYTPTIGASNRPVQLRFNVTSSSPAITCGYSPIIKNILFQNTGGTYTEGTGTLSGTTSPCLGLSENAVIEECSFYYWHKCIETGASTYYLKTSRVHFNRCTYGYFGNTTSPYDMHIDAPHSSLCAIFLSCSGTNYPRNTKIFGGSIELYSVVAEKFLEVSCFGTYFETASPRSSAYGFDPQVNGASVALYGCLVYLDATSRFVNMSGLTNAALAGSGNVFDGVGASGTICYFLPTSGSVSLSGDRFGTGHDNATLYVDTTGSALRYSGIVFPKLPAGNSHASYSGMQIIGPSGYIGLGLTAAPSSPPTGMTVTADGSSWDPLARAAGRPYWVIWQGDRWRAVDGGV